MTFYVLSSLVLIVVFVNTYSQFLTQNFTGLLGKQDLIDLEAKLGGNQTHAFQKGSNVLLVVPTANVLHRTQSLLLSLATIEDSFDLLVVDEHSTDGTRAYLELHKVKFITPVSVMGVTHNWNLAYEFFINHEQYDIMFLSNNDVLIPNGVINELSKTLMECNCDLISPLSTTRGKGHRPHESIENILGLNDTKSKEFVNLDINYQSVQNALNVFKDSTNVPYCQFNSYQDSFNGFFFGFKRNISRIAVDEKTLFNRKNRNIGQEGDLTLRISLNNLKICLNNVTFVYHYKASTIPGNMNREKFVAGASAPTSVRLLPETKS